MTPYIKLSEWIEDQMFYLFEKSRDEDEDEWYQGLVSKNLDHLDYLVAVSLPNDLIEKFSPSGSIPGFDPSLQAARDYEENWRNADAEWKPRIIDQREKAWVNITCKISRDKLNALKNISSKEIKANFNLDSRCIDYEYSLKFWQLYT